MILLILAIISLMIYPILNRSNNIDYRILKIPVIDDAIPLITIFVIPYIIYIPYLIYSVFRLSLNSKNYIWFVLSLVGIKIISGLIFYFYQTHVPRPQILNDEVLDQLLNLVYMIDRPFNCFPSTHVSLTTLFTFFWLREDFFKKFVWARYLLIVISFLIIISTVFVKQHYILDVFGGFGLAYAMIFIVKKILAFGLVQK
jgi:membrane-associated phospholipid phosphatase